MQTWRVWYTIEPVRPKKGLMPYNSRGKSLLSRKESASLTLRPLRSTNSVQRTSCVAVSLAINAIAVIWKLLPRKTNILRKIFLSSALDLLTLAVVAGYFFSMAWFMILDVKSRHIRSSPYVPFFHSLCDDCFAEFSSGLLFKSHFHLSYGDLYYKERKTWREQLYFVSLHVNNHVCWLAAVSS